MANGSPTLRINTPGGLVVSLPRRVIDLSLLGLGLVVIGILWMTGLAESIYPWMYETWPGRQWTHVFRDYKVLYLIGLGVVLVLAWFFTGHPKRKRVTGLFTLLVGLAGFLTGHVLWGAI